MSATEIKLLGIAVPVDPSRVSLYATQPVVVTAECPDDFCFVVNDARWDYRTRDHLAVLQRVQHVEESGYLRDAFQGLAIEPGDLVVMAAPGLPPLSDEMFSAARVVFGDAPKRTPEGFAIGVCPWEMWLELRRDIADKLVRQLDQAIGAGDLPEAWRLQTVFEGIEGAPLDAVRIRQLILHRRQKDTDKYTRRLFSSAQILKIRTEELEKRVIHTEAFIRSKYMKIKPLHEEGARDNTTETSHGKKFVPVTRMALSLADIEERAEQAAKSARAELEQMGRPDPWSTAPYQPTPTTQLPSWITPGHSKPR